MAAFYPMKRKGNLTGTYRVCFRWEGRTYNKVVSTEDEAKEKTLWIKRRMELIEAGHTEGPPQASDVGTWFMSQGKRGLPTQEQGTPEQPLTIRELGDAYLATRTNSVERGNLSHFSLSSDKFHVDFFVNFCERNGAKTVELAISPDNLNDFKNHLESHFNSKVSVWHGTRTIKALITWGWKNEKVDSLPRILDDFRKVELDPPSPAVFTKEEVKQLFNDATERVKLYILLGLNAGYTQQDISTLTLEMVDFQTGMIDRVRHKTKKKVNGKGIAQKTKLWQSTRKLLKKHAEKAGKLLLLSQDGNPLVWQTLKDDGKVGKVDSVQRAFNRLLHKSKITGRSFMDLRKTGASAIKNEYKPENGQSRTKTNAELFDLYLAHAPARMIRPYDSGDWQELYLATDWLACYFGLDKIE